MAPCDWGEGMRVPYSASPFHATVGRNPDMIFSSCHDDSTLTQSRTFVRHNRLTKCKHNTATSDFFIGLVQPELDFGGKRNPDGQGFAAFRRVVKKMDVVKQTQGSTAGGQTLAPPIKIVKMVRKG